jgi:predicted DNA-binding mobile mystery protein A
MTQVQLAKRLDVRPQSVEALERSEAAGTVQLDTLRRAAESLDCRLVYALVPNDSLESAVAARARAIAIDQLRRAARTMALEAQESDDEDLDMRIEDYIRNEIRDRDLWNVP